jgi:hypothetical protein
MDPNACFRRGGAEGQPIGVVLEEVVAAAQVTVGVEGRANVGPTAAIGTREYEISRRRRNGHLEVGHELRGDRDFVSLSRCDRRRVRCLVDHFFGGRSQHHQPPPPGSARPVVANRSHSTGRTDDRVGAAYQLMT